MGVWDSVLAGQASGQGASDDTAPQYMDLMTALKAKLQGAKLPQDPMERLKVGLRIGQQLKQENENPQAPAPTDDNRVPAAVQNQPASDDIGAAAQPTVPSLSSLPRNLASRVKGMQVASPLASTIPDQYAGYRSSLEDEQGKADNVQAAADAYKGIPQQLDLSPLAAQVDSWTGSKLLGGYKKPESPEERAATLAKLQSMAAGAQQSVTADQLKGLLGSDHTSELLQNRLLASAMTASKNSDLPGGVKPEILDKWTKDFGKDMNTYQKAAGPIGLLGTTEIKASRAATLIDSIPKGNLDPQEMSELGGVTAGIVTGQTRIPIELIHELVPKSAWADGKALKQWLTNDPTGTDQQKFIARASRSLHRESELADQQLHELRVRTIGAHRSLYDASPTRMYQAAQPWGVAPSEIDDTFNDSGKKMAPYRETQMGAKGGGFYTDTINKLNGQAPAAPQPNPQPSPPAAPAPAMRIPPGTKTFTSPSTGKIKYVFPDGHEEIH